MFAVVELVTRRRFADSAILEPGVATSATSTDGGGTFTMSYDDNGNMIGENGETFAYNGDNQLISRTAGGATITYECDGKGNLVKKASTDGTWTIYIGGVYEKRSDGSYVTYYSAFGRRIAMRAHSGPSDPGSLYFLLADQLGSTSTVLDATGTVVESAKYYPFGSVRSGGVSVTDKRFTGQQDEGTAFGLYDYGARFYSTVLGRFTSPDPIAKMNPQRFDRYSYTLNNPLRYTDPTGLDINSDPRWNTYGEYCAMFPCASSPASSEPLYTPASPPAVLYTPAPAPPVPYTPAPPPASNEPLFTPAPPATVPYTPAPPPQSALPFTPAPPPAPGRGPLHNMKDFGDKVGDVLDTPLAAVQMIPYGIYTGANGALSDLNSSGVPGILVETLTPIGEALLVAQAEGLAGDAVIDVVRRKSVFDDGRVDYVFPKGHGPKRYLPGCNEQHSCDWEWSWPHTVW
jgi:RHS repeat-associated protein